MKGGIDYHLLKASICSIEQQCHKIQKLEHKTLIFHFKVQNVSYSPDVNLRELEGQSAYQLLINTCSSLSKISLIRFPAFLLFEKLGLAATKGCIGCSMKTLIMLFHHNAAFSLSELCSTRSSSCQQETFCSNQCIYRDN